jgi:hypothetical protein
MGVLKKIGKWAGDRWGDGPSVKGLKSSVKGTGNFVSKAAPLATFIPGVGPLAAGALGAVGALAGGKNIGQAALSGLGGFAGAKGIDKLAGMVGGAVGSAATGIPSAATQAGQAGAAAMGVPGAGAASAASGGGLKSVGKSLVGGLLSGGGADGKGHFGAVGDFLGGKGATDLLGLGLGGMSAYEGIKSANEANALRREAMEMAKQDYATRQQFRDAAVPMLNAQRPDLSATFAGYTNPYVKKLPSVGGGR